MIQWADENKDSVVLSGILEALTTEIGKQEIAKNSFYKFVKKNVELPSNTLVYDLLKRMLMGRLKSGITK